MSMNFEFEISIHNIFECETPEEAVSQMIEWLQEAASQAMYRYENLDTGEHGKIDAERI